MNHSHTNDTMPCNFCTDRLLTPDANGRLTRNGASEYSLTGYGAINNSFDDYEYNKEYSPDADMGNYLANLENSSCNTQRNYISIESRILKPYSAILKLLGMRAFQGEFFIHRFLSVFWPILLFACLISGYIINYEVCQNEESRGNEICSNSSLSYIYMDSLCDSTLDSVLPSVIHFIAFFYTFWIFRVKRSEQVEALVQKCFVTNFFGTNTDKHKRELNRKLKLYSLYGTLSLLGLLVMTLLNSYFGKTLVLSKCMIPYNLSAVEKYLTGVGYAIPMFLMHITYFPILINYIMQSELIGFLIRELRETLSEKRTTLKTIMQEAHDTSEFLHKMNHESSPAVSLMLFYLFYGFFIDLRVIIYNSVTAGSFAKLWEASICENGISVSDCDIITTIGRYGRVSLLSILVKHIILVILVFILIFEGCRVNMYFRQLVNQAMMTRVFGFKTACFHELDSFHYYIKSLRMRAKLFQFPMETKRLLLPFVIIIYVSLCVFMTWG